MDASGSINDDTIDVVENEEEVLDDSEERELVKNDSSSTKALNTGEEPHDNYRIVYMLFLLFGITSLVPWNFLITANDYWMYKFRDVKPNNLTMAVRKTPFQAEFTSYLNVATAVSNLLFFVLHALYGHLVSLRIRIQGAMIAITIGFVVTTVFVQINTDNWQNTFFIITIVLCVIMTAGSAVFVGSLVGVASRFPEKYMAAVVSGQSLGGIIAAVAQIVSLAFKISPLHSALIYFIMADILVIVSLVSYVYLYRINFFTYHLLRGVEGLAVNRHRSVSMVGIMKKIWVYAFSIFAVFCISMSVYPAVTVLVESHPVSKGTDWDTIFFVPVVNYLIFNCGDYVGRMIAGFILRPENQWVIAGASVLRLVMVPMLMVCNAQPRRHLPVVFLWDWEYILIIVVFALTNGYLTNIIIINSNRVVEVFERERSSSMVATMLSVGITVGAAVSMLLVRVL